METDEMCLCLLCGDLMDAPNERQLEVFGYPNCCEMAMIKIDRNKIFQIIANLDNLKEKLQRETVRGTFNL